MSKLCCTETKLIGCFNSCEEIDTGLVAIQTGLHTIISYFLNGQYSQQVSINATENIIFPNIYNEVSQLTFKILNPDGTVFLDGTADCFLISFGIQISQ